MQLEMFTIPPGGAQIAHEADYTAMLTLIRACLAEDGCHAELILRRLCREFGGQTVPVVE